MSREKDRASLGAGDVTISLGGEDVVLKPTYHASRTLSKRYGGLAEVSARILRLDVDVITDVVALGMGYTSQRRPPEGLDKQIYEAGLTDDTGGIAERCVTFIRVLASGGRLPSDQGGEAGQDTLDPQ